MFERRPEDIAKKLGLDFRLAPSHDGKWVQIHIKAPDAGGQQNTLKRELNDDELRKHVASSEAKTQAEYISRVTTFRKRIQAWTIDPPPPGETGIFCAAELTFGNRWTVHKWNKENRAKMQKFWAPDAQARRAAMTQETPAAALRALSDTLKVYGIKQPDAETLKLKAQLEIAAAIVEREDSGVRVDVNRARPDPLYRPGMH